MNTVIDELRALDTCAVCNAVEASGLRLRNEGFADRSIRQVAAVPGSMVGHAVPVRIRCSAPPPDGHPYLDRTDWWQYILSIPAPRVVVVEDADPAPGLGAFVGEVHGAILRALGCVGVVTNGTVRDVPAAEAAGFHLFASGTSVSHAYVHIVDFGSPALVGGLRIAPGELVHGDRHGVMTVPAAFAGSVPAVSRRLRAREQEVLRLCGSHPLDPVQLRELLRAPLPEEHAHAASCRASQSDSPT